MTRGPRREEQYTQKNLYPTFRSGRTSVAVRRLFCEDGPLESSIVNRMTRQLKLVA